MRADRQWWWMGMVGILVMGCSPLNLVNSMLPQDTYRLSSAIAYGNHPRQRLDIYQPTGGGQVAQPVVIFFYGGSWQSSERENYRFVGEALASRGIITVIPDLRLYSTARFPTFVQDAARVFRWVQSRIDGYAGDTTQLYLMGHSSGAHIATLLALDPAYRVKADVAGVIGLAGPYDFLPLESATVQAVFADTEDLSTTQPINFVTGNDPPFLLLTGSNDKTVDPGNSLRLAARMRELGGSAQLILYPQVSHELIIGAMAFSLRTLAPTLEDIVSFIHDSLK